MRVTGHRKQSIPKDLGSGSGGAHKNAPACTYEVTTPHGGSKTRERQDIEALCVSVDLRSDAGRCLSQYVAWEVPPNQREPKLPSTMDKN